MQLLICTVFIFANLLNSQSLSIFPEGSALPEYPSFPDSLSFELGTQFFSDVPGFVIGVRFYKGLTNTGLHTGALWSITGTLLANTTFTSETAEGWQEALLSSPIAIQANTQYVVSYHCPNGNYAFTPAVFAEGGGGVNNGVLHAPAISSGVKNCRYKFGVGTVFPDDFTGSGSNYFIDVVFTESLTLKPTSTSRPPSRNPTRNPSNRPKAKPSSRPTVKPSNRPTRKPSNVPSRAPTQSPSVILSVSPSSIRPSLTTPTNFPLSLSLKPSAKLSIQPSLLPLVSFSKMPSRRPSIKPTTSRNSFVTLYTNQSSLPEFPSFPDSSSYELGTQFFSDVPGFVIGVRFYKGLTNTGVHTGALWSITGTLLANTTFTSETAEGWQEALLPSPIAIQANTQYVVSYHCPNGNYAFTPAVFAEGGSGVNNGVLHAPAISSGVKNCRYKFGVGTVFPDDFTGSGSNYFIDLIFSESLTLTPTSTPRPHPSKIPTRNPSTRPTAKPSRSPSSVPTSPPSSIRPNPSSFASLYTNLSSLPEFSSYPDSSSYELGTQFFSDVPGFVIGVRFYKGLTNTGIHTGALWSITGTLLANTTFTSETAEGWQEALLPNPVAIQANTQYVVSYHCPNGNYAFTPAVFAEGGSGVNNGVLHAPAISSGVRNCRYKFGVGTVFPDDFTGSGSNYFIDLVFVH